MSKHLGKKIVSVFIALVMVLSSFPVANVFAADTEYAKVSALTDGSSIENNGSDIITVNYDESVKLDWSKAEPAIGRNADGWWVGIKIIAPENYSEEASYIAHYNGVEQARTNTFESAKDSKPEAQEQYIQMWGFINEAVLNNAIVNGEFIENYYEFDWDGDMDYEQTIYVDVDPNAVELYNGEALVYPDTALGNVGVITESDKMSIDNNNSNVVTITNKENEVINLQWSQKNAYRSADGWWAGIKMTAPEGFSSEAKYKTLYNGYDTWSPAKSFNDNKDGDSYIELWAFVNEKVKDEYASIDNYYQFDWDNDGVFEQYVVFSLDTDSIELDKTNLLAMDTAKPIISGLVDSVNYKNDDVTVEFDVVDGATVSNSTEYTSGIYNVYYTDEKLDVVNVANVTALKEANKVDDSKYNFTVSNDTNKYYYIYAVDNSDNIEEGSVLVQVDKTPAQFDANPVVEPTGWTKNTVVIKGEISDNLSGINGKNNFTVTTDAENVHLSYSAIDEKTGEYTINIPAQTFSGTIVIDCVDNAGNKSTQSFSVQMDTTNCKIMSLEVSNSDWTSDDVIIEGMVIDNESGVKNVTAVLNGEHDSAKEPEVAYADGKYTITVPAQNYYGTITVNAEDNVGNNQADKDSSVSNLTVELKMDTDKPTVDEAKLSEDGWTNKDITVEGKVSDNLSEVRAVYYAKGNSIEDLDLSNIASKTFPADFDEETNTYKFKIDKQNYSGNYVIYAVDNAGNISDPKTVTVHMDTAAPVNLNIGYSDTLITKVLEFITFGFYKNDGADVIVTFTAEDAEVDSVSSGISKIAYSVNGGEYTEVDTTGTYALTLNGEFKDTFKFKAYDNAGNESAECNSIDNSYRINGIIHDVTLPVIQEGIQYSSPSNTLENGKMYFNNNVNIKFPIVEEYFYKEYEIDGETVSTLDKNVVVTVTKDGNIVNNYSLSMTSVNDGDTENAITVNIPVNQNGTTDGDYKVKLAYTDLSGNTVEIESKQFVIDTTAPIVNIEYDNNTVSDKAYDDTYFDKNRTATITVEEHNFAPEYIESAITANDVNGNDVTAKALEDIADITDITKWHQDETDKNKYTYVIDYSDDANYTFSFTSAKDYASNEMNPENDNKVIYAEGTVSPETFTVDKVKPSDVNISYSTNFVNEFLDFVTFGFYKAPCTVTLTTTDETSGVQYFDYEYYINDSVNTDGVGKKVEKASVTSRDGSTYECKFEIPAQFRGQVKANATDNSGNATEFTNDSKTIVVDDIAPGISVSYPEATNKNGSVDYYDSDVTVTVTVTEENFMDGEFNPEVSDMKVSAVIKDDNESEINKTYSITDWHRVNNTDVWEGTFKLEDEGDYALTIEYTDKSGNKANTHTRQNLTIDKTSPVVNIEYDNNTVSDKAYDDTYFDKNRTATITVEEHNFAPEYIESAITANDVNGNDVTAKALEDIADITDITKWHQDETDKNKYTYVIDYSDDANYTFSFTSAKDYASNEMNPENDNKVIYAEGTVSPETFTVDKVKPSEEVKYTISNDSNNLIKKVFNVLTFGIFFNSEIDIKVDTTDAISGLYRAELSIKNTDASEIENLSVNGSGIFNLKEDKSKGDTTFVVDVSKLDEFRGNLYITIYDKAGNAYRNYRIVSDGSAEDPTEELIEVDGQITVNNKVIDNDVYVVDNVEQYESIDYHKEISSIDIAYTSAVNSTVNQSSPAKDSAASLVEEKVNTNAVTDKNMSADNVPLFNTNVPLSISVTDNSSGISAIDIMVFDANENREIATYNTVIRNNGTIVSDTNREFSDVQNGNWSLTQNEYGLTTSASKEIIVKSDRNDIVVLVQLTDNAGNISYDYYQFGIDKTAPVLSAVFNDTTNYQNSVYYNEKRTLTLTVAERDFTNSGRTVEFTYNYQGNTQRYVIAANQFRQLDANVPVYRDNKRYSYTFDVFTNDGEYADFAFKAVDRANNETSADSSIIRSANNNMFRYDHIAPVITVVSDQHGRNENTKFYQDNRVITVTVKDRYATYNRDQSYIVSQVSNLTNFRFTDSENGQAYHTDDRTLTYVFTFQTNTSIDCRLLFNRVSDLAGNTAGNVPTIANANDFVVDGKTPNTFTATVTEDNHSPVNVLNQSDYKVFVGDNITLAITCDDENLSLANISNVRLVCAALTSGGSTEDKTFNLQKLSSSNRSRLAYSISDLDYDGFYDLSFTVTDDSGKVSSTQNVKFALCRNGALYSKTDIEKIETRVAYNAESISDIAFNQYSAQAGTSATLSISSKNGSLGFKSRILVEGTDYVITGGNTRDNELNCYKSIYQLLPNAFMMEDGRILDGVYLITITPNNTESANGQKSEQAQSTSFEVTLDATNPVISNVCTSYKTSYGSEKDYEFSQDEKKRLFTNEIELNFNISDTFSGIDPSTIVVTWGEQVIEDVLVNEDGTCTVVLNSNDPNNGNVIKLSVKDNAGNTIEYSFTLNIDNHFWIYVVVAVFVLIAVLLIIILAIKRKKEQNAE